MAKGMEKLPVSVSVLIPTLNEAESIGQVIDEIPRGWCDEMEIVIIDGNSSDGTREIASAKGARVVLEPRKGYGRAYRTGFAEAHGDIICTLDGDCTYPAEEFPRLVRLLLDQELDFITCDRLSRLWGTNVMSAIHRIGNAILTISSNILFGLKIVDSQSGMWIFRKSVVGSRCRITHDGMPLSEEIKIEAWTRGLTFMEVPVAYRIRVGEVKLSTWGDGWANLKFLFAARVQDFRRFGRPLDSRPVSLSMKWWTHFLPRRRIS